MYREGHLKYKHSGDYQAVELPYGPRSPDTPLSTDLSMIIILPEDKSVEAFNSVSSSFLKPENFSSLVDQLFELKLKLYLPRFSLEEAVDMTALLQNLGIKSAFASADFSRLSSHPTFISKVLHKAVVKVNEEGTEAAAATAILMPRSMAIHRDPIVRADHPFIFFIWDRTSRTVLFLGQCVKPTPL